MRGEWVDQVLSTDGQCYSKPEIEYLEEGHSLYKHSNGSWVTTDDEGRWSTVHAEGLRPLIGEGPYFADDLQDLIPTYETLEANLVAVNGELEDLESKYQNRNLKWPSSDDDRFWI